MYYQFLKLISKESVSFKGELIFQVWAYSDLDFSITFVVEHTVCHRKSETGSFAFGSVSETWTFWDTQFVTKDRYLL